MHMKILLAIVVVLIILVAIYYARAEGFQSCSFCDDKYPKNRPVAINPFIWPYSASGCPTDYIDKSVQMLAADGVTGPVYSLNTPDHAALTE